MGLLAHRAVAQEEMGGNAADRFSTVDHVSVAQPLLEFGKAASIVPLATITCSHDPAVGMTGLTPAVSIPSKVHAKGMDYWMLASGESGNDTLGAPETESEDEAEPKDPPSPEADSAEGADSTDSTDSPGDDELGILRVRSQPLGIDSELGLLRIRPTEDVPLEVEPEPTRQTSVFLTGRANIYGGGNLFRTPNPIDDRIYQTGVGIFAFPKLSDNTNLVLSAEANLARYEDLSVVDYNELQFQAGIRQRLGQRSFGQLNWRRQDLNTPGSESFFTANYIELLLSRRDILNHRTWLDTYYQARWSTSDPKEFSRFTQIATGSLNYGFTAQTRISLLYQLFIDDYTEISRHDTYHQVLAQASHDISSTTRISLFTGLRFGRSSLSSVNFDDTIYGASINVNLPLF
ncbi:MAG: hypothetical protein AAF808_12725 [Cyanobacteria bacterium P01_D01_bin.2]